MLKKSFLNIIFFFLAISLLANEKPNVVMIVLDDLNDYLGVMDGHPQAITPNLDRLAGQGILFESAHSNAPVCAPSRSSFMFGIYPSTSGNYGFDHWHENETLINSKSLPVYMQENGYSTFQTGKVFHHNSSSEWMEEGIKKNQGPVAYNGKDPVAHPSVPKPFADVGLLDGTFAPLSDIPSIPASGDAPGFTGWWHTGYNKEFKYVDDENRDLMTDEESAEWFKTKINYLESIDFNQPFFISVGIMNPHTPHVVPQKYYDRYPLDSLKIPVIADNDIVDCHYGEVLGGKGPSHFEALKNSYTDLDLALRSYLQGYLACVSFSDDVVGSIMATLDSTRFKDNTIVILFSDHGYNMGEKDYLFKNSLWEESTRVPFIIRAPEYAHQAGKKVSKPIGLIDVFPTVKELCGLEGETTKNSKGAQLDGFSVVPLMDDSENGKWEGPDVALTVVKNPGSNDAARQNYSIRSENYRYVGYSNGSEELYDHRYDSYEWINEAGNEEYDSIKQELKAALEELIPGATTSMSSELNWIGNLPWFFTESNWIDALTGKVPETGVIEPDKPINRDLKIDTYDGGTVGPVAGNIVLGTGKLTLIKTKLLMNPNNNVGIFSDDSMIVENGIIDAYFIKGGKLSLNMQSKIVLHKSDSAFINCQVNFQSFDNEIILTNIKPEKAVEQCLSQIKVNNSEAVLNENIHFDAYENGTKITTNVPVGSVQFQVDDVRRGIVYPNPASDVLYIIGLQQRFSFAIYNQFGQLQMKNEATNCLDISSLDDGFYFIIFENNDSAKFLVKRNKVSF